MAAQLHGITMHAMERYVKNGWTGGRIAINPSTGVALRRRPIVEINLNPSSCLVGGAGKKSNTHPPACVALTAFSVMGN